jgi:ABC-type antimicrobial peptide transport system permease subunit
MLVLRAVESHTETVDASGASRLAWLSAVSLLMCMLGVTNSMLMSVTERYREIGTIKCLGATNGFIVRLFLLEAGILGVVASIAGATLGAGLMAGVLALSGYDIPLRLVVDGVPMAAGAGLLLTLISAVLPAVAAARMPAVAALRVEV